MKSSINGRWLKKSLKFFIAVTLLLCLRFTTIHFESQRKMSAEKTSCHIRIPRDSEIITDKVVWQILKAGKKTLKFFNAYLDTRRPQAYVRVNSNGPREYITNSSLLYCQFWYESGFETVNAVEVQNMVPS